MNDLFVLLGIESWKPVITALLLPPAPLLVSTLAGARMISWRRGLGWVIVALSVVLMWLSCCTAVGEWLLRHLLHPPLALTADRIDTLKREAAAGRTAIVVLGGGAQSLAPEYGLSNLEPWSLERLRYGLWLGRETGLPVAFSGGVGFGRAGGPSEAEIAARIAAREFGRPLRWHEDESRDTRENATRSIAMLKPAGITQLVLVTHAFHMPRARRDFEDAARRVGPASAPRIVPAPVGLALRNESPVLRWIPSYDGFTLTRQVLREQLGLLAGA
ncbi:MAG TPA: YdcF family protein [Burkholderiaceae bacterium]|nr:YdcF family protein [Burkholderiaceae bacterium]